MQVLDHEPHFWFLLEEAGRLYLDVNCQSSAVGYSVIVRLTDDEARMCRQEGRSAVRRLARDIEDHHLSSYRERNLASELGPAVHAAIVSWRAANSPS